MKTISYTPPAFNHARFIKVTADHAGQRIDNFLITLEKGVPKSRIYRAIRTGEVRVNSGRAQQTYKIQAGDNVRIPPLRTSKKIHSNFVSLSVAERLNDSIVLENDDLILLNKPAGLAVHAGSNVQQGVIEALRIIRNDLPYLKLAHRLDRDTSGCLLLAKNRDALLSLQRQLLHGSTDKHYLALLKGGWNQQEIIVEQPLRKHTISSNNSMVIIDDAGKYAKTLFIPLKTFPQVQLTEAVLYTGRTHQIRVHATYINHPLAGDDKYGQRELNKDMKRIGLKRLFLHSWKLGIICPSTGKKLMLEVPLPTTLENVLNKLGK